VPNTGFVDKEQENASMQGLHLTGDLYGCAAPASTLTDAAQLSRLCVQAVQRSGLTWVGDKFHAFDEQAAADRQAVSSGVTGMVLLAESHVALHTWPERMGVTLDVYVCNYSADNSAKARTLFDALVEAFRPAEIDTHTIWRGKHDESAPNVLPPETSHASDVAGSGTVLTEWLNPDAGFSFRASRLVEKGQSDHQHYEVWETPQLGKLFRLDGAFMTSEEDEFVYHENLVHVPAIAHPHPTRALVIGGGDGGSSEELLKHPSMEMVHLVELDAKVIEIAKRHLPRVHNGVFDNPKLKVDVRDGAAYLRQTEARYDLVVLDLTDPVGPSEALYTEAFYRSCQRVLRPGGAVVLHIGAPYFQQRVVKRNIANLKAVFKLVRPYAMPIPIYGAYWGMAVASDLLDPLDVSADEVERRLLARGITDLRYYTGATHQAVFVWPRFAQALL
jgi:spermidine synthase